MCCHPPQRPAIPSTCCCCLLRRWSLYKFGEPLLLGSRLRKRALAECMKHIHYEVSLA